MAAILLTGGDTGGTRRQRVVLMGRRHSISLPWK
jgi:hypothetical protein